METRIKIIAFAILASVASGATSVTRHAITWTFDTDYTVGTFANGDPYVVENSPGAGVRVISITGSDTATSVYRSGGIVRIKNGSMVNPSAKEFALQGFDSYMGVDYNNGGAYGSYLAALNAARPVRASGSNLAIDASDATKVSSATHSFDSADVGNVIQISTATGGWTAGLYVVVSASGGVATVDRTVGTTGISSGTWKIDSELSGSNYLLSAAGTSIVSSIGRAWATPSVSTARPTLSDASVLTVLSAAPAAGSFRPPYCGTDKSVNWNKSDLDYTALRSLAPVTGAPTDLTGTENGMDRVWIEIGTGTDGRYFHPSNNQPDYGRDMAQIVNVGLVALHLNFSNATKEKALVSLVQYGIDCYGAAMSGTGNMWGNTGGAFNIGRKTAIVTAARLLNSSAIAYYCDPATYPNKWQEDTSHWYIVSGDIGRALMTSGPSSLQPYPHEQYTSDMIGVAEWGANHYFNGTQDSKTWATGYRDVNYQPNLSAALGITLMDGGKALWAWPAFFDYHDRAWGIADHASNWSTFIINMWTDYRYYDPSGPDVSAPTPNPTTWATAPHADADRIEGIAVTTTDADSPPVTYVFSVVLKDATPVYDIVQSGPDLVTAGLTPGTQYDVQAKVRDAVGNYTTASTKVTVTTNAADVRTYRNPRNRRLFGR